jgi:hypothetical protein
MLLSRIAQFRAFPGHLTGRSSRATIGTATQRSTRQACLVSLMLSQAYYAVKFFYCQRSPPCHSRSVRRLCVTRVHPAPRPCPLAPPSVRPRRRSLLVHQILGGFSR